MDNNPPLAARPAHARRIGAAALLALSTGCGGGFYIELFGPAPEITLTVSVTEAQRGQTLQLAAAVVASNGIDRVSFYRIDFGSPVLLGSVARSPARWDTSVPAHAGFSVSYFAQACDLAGYCTSSSTQTVAVRP